jgi:hypothetical protein
MCLPSAHVHRCIALLVATVLVTACGGSTPGRFDTAAKAEAFVRSLEVRECHERLRSVACHDQGSRWMCVFTLAGADALTAGGLVLKKSGSGRGRSAIC